MNIVIVANGFPPTAFGGVEVYAYAVAKHLRLSGHRVHVFCRESAPDLPDNQVIEGEVDDIPVHRIVNDFKDISAFSDTYVADQIETQFREYLEKVSPDVVHFNHWIALSAKLPQVTKSLGIRNVSTLHDYWSLCHRVHLLDWRGRICPGPIAGGDCYRCVVKPGRARVLRREAVRWIRSRIGATLRRRIVRKFKVDPGSVISLRSTREDFDDRYRVFQENLLSADRITVPSSFVKSVFKANGYGTERFEILPLGVANDWGSNPRLTLDEPIRFGYIGTLSPAKGAHLLVQEFRRIDSTNIRLEIYGRKDAYPDYTKKLERTSGRDPRIHLHGGFAPDKRKEIYREIDVLVIPSIVPESFSLVAREALLSGTPVLASNIGALPEIIRHGENGFLFSPIKEFQLGKLMRQITSSPDTILDLSLPGSVPILSISDHVTALTKLYNGAPFD